MRFFSTTGWVGTDPVKVADAAEEHLEYGYKAFKLHLLLDVEGVTEICREVRKARGSGDHVDGGHPHAANGFELDFARQGT